MCVKTRARILSATTAATALALCLSACSGGDVATPDAAAEPSAGASPTDTPPSPDDGVRTIQPGEPGEEPREGSVDLPVSEHNEADVAYMQMMIPHHRQALVMSDLAKDRASTPAVRRIAARIRGAQAPEMGAMGNWLEARGEPVPQPEDDRVDMDMGMDMGMLDADELLALVEADGEDFDRLFLEGMIGHHEGAVDMSADVLETGSDTRVNELAADISVGQTAEIGRMEDVIDRL